MSKRFKVERNTGDLGIIYVTLYQPPYEDENIMNKLGWKVKDCTITEITMKYDGEE